MKEAAFFDLDLTLVNMATERVFGLYMRDKIQQPWWIKTQKLWAVLWGYLRYDLHLINDYAILKQQIIKSVMENEQVAEYEKWVDVFFKERVIPCIHPQIYQIISDHKQAERETYIVSAAIELIVKKFHEYFNTTGYFATVLEVENGLYTGNVKGKIYYGNCRGELLRELAREKNIDLGRSYAYGDYIDDKYMLGNVGNPVAINPDKKLSKLAQSNNWQVIHLE